MNLLYCFIGTFIGTLIGVLPGLGPAATIALLLPATFHISPVSAIIMLAGIYYGAMYGGSTTSILINIPGEAASVVTLLDGYQMARKGRAGPALGIAAFGSFIAGTLSIAGLMLAAPPLAKIALKFGPPEYFSLMCLGLTFVIYLGSGSMLKALVSSFLGIILGTVGMDVITGKPRFTFGMMQLSDGLDLVAVAMGFFGISEVLMNIEKKETREVFNTKIKQLFPSLQDWLDSKWAIVRGSLIGFFLGVLPGGGAVIASFVSYAIEKRFSSHPEKFGTGIIEGVAAPESANNAATGGAFIPLFTLGIPSNIVMAILLGALMIHGIQPGPLLMKDHPEIFWGTIMSMYIGNCFLLILNLPLIPLWVKVLKIPYKILFPLILFFCLIGAYSLNNSVFDIYCMLVFGIIGYLLRKLEYELAPLILSFVLTPILEPALRQSLSMSKGSFLIFISRPISTSAILITMVLLILPFFSKWRAPETS